MNILLLDDVLSDSDQYVRNIHSRQFSDFVYAGKTYQNIQPGQPDDELAAQPQHL